MKFTGKIALVTGASSGIGEATAIDLASRGAGVFLTGRDEDRLRGVCNTIRERYGYESATYESADLRSPADVERLFDVIDHEYGKLDMAVNNAAIVGDLRLLKDTSLETWNDVIATNITGMFLCMRSEIQRMGPGGSIVNVGSGASLSPLPYQGAYTASKGAVVALTKVAALECAADGIRINTICPGGTETPLVKSMAADNPAVVQALVNAHPMGRISTPEEQAGVIAFLLSDASSTITGAVLSSDCGWLLS